MDLSTIFDRIDVNAVVPNIITSVIIIVIAIAIWQFIKKGFNLYYKKQFGEDRQDKDGKQFTNGVLNIIKIVIVIVVVLAVLQINGINVGGLIASLGITGAILGLAIQDFLKDVVMGTHIKADHFFKVDDVIKYNGHEGVVIFFNSKTTKIKDIYTNEIVSICNRELTNVVKSSTQVDIDLLIPYEIESAHVNKTLEKAVEEIAGIENIKKCVYKGLHDFEDCGIVYKIMMYCSPRKKPDLRRAALRVIQEHLNAASIPIAVPIQEVGVTMRKES